MPLLAGWNRDEGMLSWPKDMTVEKWKAFAAEHFGDRADEFLKLYPGETDEQAVRSAIDYGSDAFIAFGTWKWIEAHRKTGDSPVYRYHFELPHRPANSIRTRSLSTPTTSSMSSAPSTRVPALCGSQRIAN